MHSFNDIILIYYTFITNEINLFGVKKRIIPFKKKNVMDKLNVMDAILHLFKDREGSNHSTRYFVKSVANTLANEWMLYAEAHRDYIPAKTITVALHLTDCRWLSSVHSLLPIVFDLRRGTVFVLVIIRPGMLPLSQLPLGDLRNRRRRTRNRDRLPLDRPLLLLSLLLVS